jgi:hypothetical protein
VKGSRRDRPVAWRRTASAEHPYEADVDGQRWTVRVNDFPAEALYTLLVDGAPVEDVEAWPAAWTRPVHDGVSAGSADSAGCAPKPPG